MYENINILSEFKYYANNKNWSWFAASIYSYVLIQILMISNLMKVLKILSRSSSKTLVLTTEDASFIQSNNIYNMVVGKSMAHVLK